MSDLTVPKGLTARQEAGLAALLNCATVLKAAEQAGVTDRTLRRWMEEPAFARAYRRARREQFAHAMSLTQRYAPLAVQELVKVMADASAPHSARVSACTTLLKFGRESIEVDELAGRIESLEQAAAQQQSETGVRKWA